MAELGRCRYDPCGQTDLLAYDGYCSQDHRELDQQGGSMTYVEQRWTGWWAECDTCEWTAGPCDTQAEATAHADRHDLAMGR